LSSADEFFAEDAHFWISAKPGPKTGHALSVLALMVDSIFIIVTGFSLAINPGLNSIQINNKTFVDF
jgi:hypothetical protein